MLTGKKILLIISGGIAAYKALELIRLIRRSNGTVRCILTEGGARFITELSVASLSGEAVYTDLWSLKDETEMGHIRLSREADMIVVAPASANLIAKMAQGISDDLASTTLLATNRPVLVCPAMNPMMWENKATDSNIETLRNRGIHILNPGAGEMACGEVGAGRLPKAADILEHIIGYFQKNKPLAGRKALVTSGPTYEAIDPVRFIGNRSSGKQGHAIASHLAALGASVIYITGPSSLPAPESCDTIRVESAADMLEACEKNLPADIAICAAAVADWRPEHFTPSKLKKEGGAPPEIRLQRTDDILARLSTPSGVRPKLVIGFAAETDNVVENAKAKLARKGCDWLVVNPVTTENPVFGSDENHVYFLADGALEEWPRSSKDEVARALCEKIADHLTAKTP